MITIINIELTEKRCLNILITNIFLSFMTNFSILLLLAELKNFIIEIK